MRQGHFSYLFHSEGGELAVHFFEPNVLDHYRQHPDYNFHGNSFYTKEDTGKRIDPSGIQKFVWAQKPDGKPCVAALRSHLVILSTRDQMFWHSRELDSAESETAKICSRYMGPMLYGAWPDTMSRFAAVYLYLREISKLFAPDSIFPALPDEYPDFLAPLPYGSKRAFVKFSQDLYSILDMNPTALASRVRSEEKNALMKRHETWNLLQLYFEENGVSDERIREGIRVIKELNSWRSKSAHTIQPPIADKDYHQLQGDIMWRLQAGLRSMLLALATVEKKSTKIIPNLLLNLGVE